MNDHPPEGYVRLGRLGRTFQLEGATRFQPLGPAEAAALADVPEVFVEGLGLTAVSWVRPQGRNMIVKLARVHRIERAKELTGAWVYVDPTHLPPADERPYYDHLIDLPVTVDGQPFGTVRDLIPAGGQDLLVIAGPSGEVLVPLQAPYVRIDERVVAITEPPAGLLTPE